MDSQFRYLLSPLKVGSTTIRNRTLITAHGLGYAQNNMMSERHAYYYAERAKGGVGLVITEYQVVHPSSLVAPQNNCQAFGREAIPHLKRVAEMVHEHGAKIFGQLNHYGNVMDSGAGDNWSQVWAPSPVPSVLYGETPKAVELEEIKELVEGYGRTAANIREAGFDGVEIHGAHGYLIEQFLSPIFNKRTDQYGGNPVNRARFMMEVIESVRKAVGKDFTVGLRISADELVPGGLTTADWKEWAVQLEDSGKIDFLDVSGGIHITVSMLVAPMVVPLGVFTPLSAEIKSVIQRIPVFVANRINDPIQAEKILADGQADMVAMTRAFLCDPELINKTTEGKVEDIRHCVACNQGCLGRRFAMRPVTCVQNVAAGREKELGIGSVKPAAPARSVMVIGGGPAGMEAARVAAARGHKVTLYEMSQELGGQVNIAAAAPHRGEWGEIARFLRTQLQKLGVAIRVGVEVTPDMVMKQNADAVIVATGSTPLRSGFVDLRPDLMKIPGAEQDNVLTVWDVLQQRRELGENVLLVDNDKHHQAAAAAEFILDHGKKLEIISRFFAPAMDMQNTMDFGFFYQRVLAKGLTFVPGTMIKEISGKTVVVYSIYSGAERTIEGVDTVVLATGSQANDGLYRALKERVRELYAIGDCVAPRRVANAIWEGNMVGRKL